MPLVLVGRLTLVVASTWALACSSPEPSSGVPYRPDRDGADNNGATDPWLSDPLPQTDPTPGDPRPDVDSGDPGDWDGGDPATCFNPEIGSQWSVCYPMALGPAPLLSNTSYVIEWGDTTHASYEPGGTCEPVCLASEYCAVGPECWRHNQVDIIETPGTNCVDAAGGYDDIFVFLVPDSGNLSVRIEDVTAGSAANLSVFVVLAWWDEICGHWLCSNTEFENDHFVACDYDFVARPDFTAAVQGTFWYYVIVDGESGAVDKGRYKLTVTTP